MPKLVRVVPDGQIGPSIAIAEWGYGGTGKDEVGRYLVGEYGFVRYAKGDYIKRAVEAIDPWIRTDDSDDHVALSVLTGRETLAALSDTNRTEGDWLAIHDAVKRRYPDLRRYQQRVADAVIEVTGRDPWNDAMWDDIRASGADRVIQTRITSAEEAETWTANGGVIWRIERPGYGPANADPNETRLADWPFDATIVNDGTIDDLHAAVRYGLSVTIGDVADHVPGSTTVEEYTALYVGMNDGFI
jgi:hypothetical protein